ncbi:DNA repair nuclease/redox regulator APEX1 [Patagioenas fasciata]|uniref:DNA repair nuclease/redox regulator APEX1 n=1 Tax=Patagioenas fasciata TaxID=372321 RepID=UPI003A9A59CE
MPKRSRKEAAEGEEEGSRPAKGGRGQAKGVEPALLYVDPPLREVTPGGQRSNFKVTSWNVDGLRAWVRKGALQWVQEDAPDVLLLQETKCAEAQVPPEVRALPRLPHQFWASASGRGGYSGVGLLARERPLDVTYGIGDPSLDAEGRVITAELPSLFLVCAYVPNSGRGLARLAERQRWDRALRAHLSRLDARKPVLLGGDLNVAYQELDLRHPRANRRSPGFTNEEREAFGELLGGGFIDSFRFLYPGVPNAFTFWTHLGGARGRNVGWRLDYFVLSRRLRGALCDSKIRNEVMGSDHCPVSVYLALGEGEGRPRNGAD